MDEKCENCRFSKSLGVAMTYCRRYPPQPRDGGLGKHPEVRLDGWCGEWRARKESEED